MSGTIDVKFEINISLSFDEGDGMSGTATAELNLVPSLGKASYEEGGYEEYELYSTTEPFDSGFESHHAAAQAVRRRATEKLAMALKKLMERTPPCTT